VVFKRINRHHLVNSKHVGNSKQHGELSVIFCQPKINSFSKTKLTLDGSKGSPTFAQILALVPFSSSRFERHDSQNPPRQNTLRCEEDWVLLL
jgi:hypothetical protein